MSHVNVWKSFVVTVIIEMTKLGKQSHSMFELETQSW